MSTSTNDQTATGLQAATATPTSTPLVELAHRIEDSEALDGMAEGLARALPSWLTTGRSRDLLAGKWLGHSLHPLLTDLPLGFWSSASLLDLVGDDRHAAAARRLVGFGLLSSLPTALAGLSDWSKLDLRNGRVGLVHGQLNVLALLLYGASYVARRRPGRGVLFGVLGGLAASVSGYLGGHLTLDRAVTRDNRLLDH